jgi:capsular polysaccharide transport system permease protein
MHMTEMDRKTETIEQMRDRAWKRALTISDELRKSARLIRSVKSKTGTDWTLIGDRLLNHRRFNTIPNSRLRWAPPALGFLVPVSLTLAYINLGMSDQYMSEARFAVRGGERVTVDPIASLTGLSSFTQGQDSLIVANYLRSQTIVEDLDHTIGLREMFSRHDIDWLSRFNRNKPIEDLVKYWRWKIKTHIEAPSGIITFQVTAFSPADSLKIANAVVASSEQLINAMSRRALRDAMEEADSELARSEKRLGEIREALHDLRNAQSTLDPRRTAEGINKLIGELRLERARLEEEANAARRSQVNESAPQIQLLRTRIQVVGDQIVDLERQLTSTTETAATPVSGKITRFDELELERQIAEKQYTLAVAAFERARVNAERQKVYLMTFVRPLLPQDVAWPKRFWLSLGAFTAVATLYWIGASATRALLRRGGL